MSSSSPSTHGETHGSGMDGSDSSSLAVPRLPDDAIVAILSRLRAKSLCRCKCVSKPWRDLIADRLCCKDLPQTLQGFLYFGVGSRGGGDGSSDGGGADANAGDRDGMLLRHVNGRFINLLGKTMPLLDPSFTFLKEQPGIQALELLDSCNGLLLFGHSRVSDTFHSLGYIVCNPVTEQWVAVPSTGWTPTPPEEIVDGREKAVRTFLIFDPSVSSHFELVQFWQDEMAEDVEDVEAVYMYMYIYSSGTGLWNDRSSEFYAGGGWENWWGGYGTIEKTRHGSRAFVNGMLHFLIYKPWHVYEIVAVGGQAKKCRVIRWPELRLFPRVAFIGQSQGRLHCMSSDVEDRELKIWVLEDYDTPTEEWVLRHSVSYSQLFEGMDYFSARFGCVFAGLHADRNLIFFAHCLDRSLISYDMDSREVCVLCTLLGRGCYVTPYVPSFKPL